MVGPDGAVRLSERPVVALCACRRSRHQPFCDTSHRRHGARRDRDRDRGRSNGPSGSGGSADSGGPADSGGSTGSAGAAGSVGQG
ncbi:CDGSH iron-sulfur domain-containing protein [Kitasatospora purpeofusca]|uniref:CDGSH iron-sulfur domain-containing protein n=1 Tax=Kitasatospora purpeofusca TaxID=67352 RepID=UPI0036E1F573